jgi:hypothetical protein
MADTKPIPVRLDTQIIARLDAAAKRLGNNRAGIIKLCVSTFLDHMEAHGGRMALPPDWEEILARLDGRTRDARASRTEADTGAKRISTRGVSSTVTGAAAAGARGALAKALREAQASSPRPPVAAPTAGKSAPKRGAGGRSKSPPATPTPAPTESST